jgi:Holliday junction resolvase RusA-like endonuclease
VIRMTVLGMPAPKGSSRAILRGGKAVNVPGSSDVGKAKIIAWTTAVRQQALLTCGDIAAPVFVGQPIRVAIVFRMQRPAGHYNKRTGELKASAPRYPATKPDGDKLERTTWDALTGIVFDDDSRIVAWSAVKEYALPGREGATIAVAAMDSGEAVAA